MGVGYAQANMLLDSYPESYAVVEGDTLWNIAGQFLQDPARWPEIWQPDSFLDDPDLIFPGDTLRITFVAGSPRVLVQRGDREIATLSPEIREEPLASAIPAIPLEAIENSFSRNRMVTQEQYDNAPYIVSNAASNLAIATGDELFARGIWPAGTRSFEIYRLGTEYLGADSEELLGLELEYLGFASITANEGPDLRRMIVNSSSQEILVGDRLLIREESRINATFFPTEPVEFLQGNIIGFHGDAAMAAQLDTVVLNLGLRDNLAVGDILSIVQDGSTMIDGVEQERMGFRERLRNTFRPRRLQLPEEEIGTIMVYKTFESLSYGVILTLTEPAVMNNRVVSP